MPPSAFRRRPGSGRPPRLMPTPSEPRPRALAPRHEGRRGARARLRVRVGLAARAAAARRPQAFTGRDRRARRLLKLGLAGIHAGAAVKQCAHRRGNAGARRRHQRGLARGVAVLGSTPASSSRRHDVGELPLRHCGQVERRDAVSNPRPRPWRQSPAAPAPCRPIGMHGGVERGGVVHAASIRVTFRAMERPQPREVALFDRGRQGHVGGAGHRGGRGASRR